MLEKILKQKLQEIKLLEEDNNSLLKKASAFREHAELRGFKKALLGGPSPRIIAEVKKASPSKGIISKDFNPVKTAINYEKNGAACISVLTDEKFFQGSLSYLEQIKNEVSLPLIRKDFIITPVQVYQTLLAKADALLLIAAILKEKQMEELIILSTELGLDVLVEVHNQEELDAVLRVLSKLSKESLEKILLGINNRDLNTFRTSIETSKKILKENSQALKELSLAVVSESGINSKKEILELEECGASAFLIGESLMKDQSLLSSLVND